MKTAGSTLWFHFGGEIYESILRELYPACFDQPVLAGIAIRVQPNFDLAVIQKADRVRVDRIFHNQGLRMLEDEGLCRFADDLPIIGVETLLANLRVADNFMEWIKTRESSSVLPISCLPTLVVLVS